MTTDREPITSEKGKRADALLAAIYDDVDRRLNPSGEDCWNCGGEEVVHDCFDGCCVDAEIGCDDCTSYCPECTIFKGLRAKAVREEVIKSNDPDLAIAWLKEIGRWNESISRDEVIAQLSAANSKLEDSSHGL